MAQSSSLTSYQFDLLTPVVLTPGNVYTLGLTTTAGNPNLASYADVSNPYAGGNVVLSNGVSHPTDDLVFAEGVPEPSGALLVLALSAVATACRRRRRPRGFFDMD